MRIFALAGPINGSRPHANDNLTLTGKSVTIVAFLRAVDPMTKVSQPDNVPSRRQQASEQRRQAILEAGLDVFAAHGFAAARLDEVAQRAGVAKGTIYLFFKNKEELFEHIVRGAAELVLTRLGGVASQHDVPIDRLLARLFEVFRSEILETKRKEIARLVICEGGRFPAIAEFYHREVIAKVLALIQGVAARAHERGELSSGAYAKFPQLIMAPLLMTLVWDGLFSKIAPLDVEGLLAAHREAITGSSRERGRQ